MRLAEAFDEHPTSAVPPSDDGAEPPETSRTDETLKKMDNGLPENDGMHALRQKLHEIRQLALSTEEKALRMHNLMTQDWLARRAAIEEPAALDVGLSAGPIDPKNPYNVKPGDLETSYSPYPVVSAAAEDDIDGEEDEVEEEVYMLGCVHYKRNVKVQCFDCHSWYSCRHCHDQSDDLPFPHQLRRKMVKNMLCMLCKTPQPAAETCMNCEEYAAWYYCSKCKFWDNDSNKRIYHCDDCGICRVGEGLGKDFVHCKKCNVCISISTSAAHPCIEGATEGDCPLCLDQLFESRADVVSLPCGHYMHGECYKELMAVTYKCPMCSKSAVNMELQWRKLDDEIRAQPMPEDDAELDGLLPQLEAPPEERLQQALNQETDSQHRRPRTVWVGCNDCGGRCWTPFHWLGLKCQVCDSYNTNQMAPTAFHETETERLIRQHQIHRHHDFTGDAVLRDAGIGAPDRPSAAEEPAQPTEQRVDSALAVPSNSPPNPRLLPIPIPTSPHSPPSSLPSPRRYFVQPDSPPQLPSLRRPSFTQLPSSATFSTPSLPNLPEMPRLPRLPALPQMHVQLPHLPPLPPLPHLPHLPHLGGALPRWSPGAMAGGMFDSLRRGVEGSMREYLQGMEMQGYDDDDDFIDGDGERVRRAPELGWRGWWAESGLGERLGDELAEGRARDASPTSVRSDPTAGGKMAGRRGWRRGFSGGFWDGGWGWELDGEKKRNGEEGDEESEGGSETGSDDASEVDLTEDDEDGEEGEGGLDMELVGHR